MRSMIGRDESTAAESVHDSAKAGVKGTTVAATAAASRSFFIGAPFLVRSAVGRHSRAVDEARGRRPDLDVDRDGRSGFDSHAGAEFTAIVFVAHVVAHDALASLARHVAATLDIARHRRTLDTGGLVVGAAIGLVADEAADHRARGGAVVASAGAVAELVTDDP